MTIKADTQASSKQADNMKIVHKNESIKDKLPEGFYYVGQDNYYIANLNKPNRSKPEKYLYSDSATSCVIIVVEGKDKDANPIIAFSHLSRTERFLKFFEIVAENFVGAVSVFAQGANPPAPAFSSSTCTYSYDALQNQQTVINWVNTHMYIPSANNTEAIPSWYIEESSLSLGLGNPQQNHRSCYGIDLETMLVSNQEFQLTDLQRDPTGGIQVLYCVFGLQVTPQIILQHATTEFTSKQIRKLVEKAKENNWLNILQMTMSEVLNKYSSTPIYEAPWFYASLRESANFVKNYHY